MRIELRCRCGAEGLWEGKYEQPSVKLAEEWLVMHRDCVAKKSLETSDVSPAGLRRRANSGWEPGY